LKGKGSEATVFLPTFG